MIAALLGGSYSSRPFLLNSQIGWTQAELLTEAAHYAQGLAERQVNRLAVQMQDSLQLVALLVAANLTGTSVCVLSNHYRGEQLQNLLEVVKPDLLVSASPGEEVSINQQTVEQLRADAAYPALEADDSEVLILTSGTTGLPKCARYAWSDLIKQVRNKPAQQPRRWLLAYHLNHFAGIQMLLHALVNGDALVVPESEVVAEMLELADQLEVTTISASPTFWRFALASLSGSPAALSSLQQITLGSEVVPAGLLENLEQRFPDARISQVYASTESGACLSVNDGKSGLPLSVLEYDADAPVQFKIEGGELYIRSRYGMQGYLGMDGEDMRDQWRATGDLVELEDDRIRFLGRSSELINVGGVKVHPQQVEELVGSVDGVHLARVYGKENALTGQIVAVDIVVNEGEEPAAVEDRVFEACLALDRHSRPRLVNSVESLEIRNRKLARGG